MKRIMTWMLTLALLLGGLCACAESDALTFEQLSGLEWSFCSGAGGWSTEMRITADGAFSGEFHDSEMGETGDDYPYGSLYLCAFTGQMSILGRAEDGTWRIRIDSLAMDEAPGRESIEDGIRYVTAEPYGVKEGDEMALYLPGTPTEAFTDEMRVWAHLLGDDTPAQLEDWFLYCAATDSGFVGYAAEGGAQLANPWTDMTADELYKASGFYFALPENAQNTAFRWMASDKLAEAQFTMDGDEYCARTQPAELKEGELMNISGMYFQWDHEEEVNIGGCRGTLGLAQTGSEDWVELCLWYDAAAGRMFSLSVYTKDPDGLDLTAVAGMIQDPVPQDA